MIVTPDGEVPFFLKSGYLALFGLIGFEVFSLLWYEKKEASFKYDFLKIVPAVNLT